MSKIYVGGLPYSTNESELHALFAEFGQVIEAKIITDRETGRSRGFGFVTFSSNDEANSACTKDGVDYEQRTLKVSIAQNKTGGRGGSRGGNRGGGGGGRW